MKQNSKLFPKLTAAIAEAHRLRAEQHKLNVMEADSRKAVDDAVSRGDANSELALGKLSLNSARLLMIPRHRKSLQGEILTNRDLIKTELRSADSAWSKVVRARVDAEYERFLDFVEPFYKSRGDARAVTHTDRVPLLNAMRSAHFNGFPTPLPRDPAEMVSLAENFLGHITSSAARFGITVPE